MGSQAKDSSQVSARASFRRSNTRVRLLATAGRARPQQTMVRIAATAIMMAASTKALTRGAFNRHARPEGFEVELRRPDRGPHLQLQPALRRVRGLLGADVLPQGGVGGVGRD